MAAKNKTQSVATNEATKPSLLERATVIATSDTSKEFARAAAMGAGAALGMIVVSSIHAALSN